MTARLKRATLDGTVIDGKDIPGYDIYTDSGERVGSHESLGFLPQVGDLVSVDDERQWEVVRRHFTGDNILVIVKAPAQRWAVLDTVP